MNRSEIRKKWKQNQSGLDGSYLDKLQNNIKKSQQQMKEFEQKLYNKEIQQRKNDLSSKLPGNNAFTKGPANKYTLGAGILPQKSLENNVNNKFMQIMAQTQEKKENTVPDKSILLNPKAEVPLNKNQLEKLSEMDRKDRIKALKGRSEETLQQAETYTLEKKNKETEKKVNEAEGFNKLLPTAEYLGKEFAQNMASAFAGLGATAEHIQGRDNNLEGLRYAQNLQGAVNKLGENVNNKFIQALGTGVGGVGQQMPQILLGLPGTGALVGGFSEFSNTYNEMTLEDPNNKSKTLLTAFLKGTAAGTLDKLMGGLSSKIFGKGVLDDFAKKQLAQIKNGLVRNAAASGIGVLGEISEEELENIAGYIIDKVVNNKDVTIEQIIEEGKETFKQTGMTTIIMSMFGLGGDLGYNAKKLATQYDMIEQAELPTRDRELLRTFAEENDLSNEELYREIVKVNQENAMYDAFLKSTVTNVENSEKQAATIENEPLLNKEQQVTSKQAKITENAISRKPTEMNDLSTKIPGSEYKYEKSDNEKIDNFRKQAAQYWNNSKKTQNYIKMIEKVIEDKDLVINLDPNMELKDGNIVNGNYKNGVITINPYGKDIAEAVLVHEVTHAIGTKQMIKMVEKFRENNKEFDDSVKSLLTTYNIEEINEEALAFASQELLGNKYFIEDVANNNPTIFEKIYNEIKAWWHQLRGYKNENEFIEDLYNRWTAAYHSKRKLNDTEANLLSENATKEIEEIASETREQAEKNKKQFVRLKDNTIKTLVDYGVKDYPMMARRGHVRENILTPSQAKELGYSTKNKHFHSLGTKKYLEIIDSMDDPVGVYQYTEKGDYDENNFIVLTKVEINGVKAIVPVEINEKGQENNIEIDLNRIKTVYSKNNNSYVDNLLKNGKIKEIFNGSNSRQKSQTIEVEKPISNNSITQNNDKVNKNETDKGLEESSSFNLQKNEQYKIIQETNPAPEGSNYVWIRRAEDIKTWKEVLELDDDKEGQFVWGDFSREDAEKALKRGTVRVYSSYPIKNGVFVSTSYQQALDYAGGEPSNVHSRNVALDSVAWINGDEGQYAKVKPKTDENKAYQKTLDDAVNALKVQNKTSDLDIYYKATQIANGEFKNLKTDEDYDRYYARIAEIEKDLNKKINPDIRYSIANENNKVTNFFKDNKGRKLTKEQIEFHKDVSPEVLDEEGNLKTVYHTTTNTGSQFNEFNPVGTPGYRFGKQVVNYYTDSKEMSGSYADSEYIAADTRKLNNIEDANNYLNELAEKNKDTSRNVYAIKKNEDNTYSLVEESPIDKEALDFLNSLSDNELEQMKNSIYRDELMAGTPYEAVFNWVNFDKELNDKYHELTNKYLGNDAIVDIQRRMIDYLENGILEQDNIIKTYDSENKLLRNLKQDIQTKDWTNNSKRQYEGYVNLKNPYVIDAQGRNWDRVNEIIDKEVFAEAEEIKKDINKIVALEELADESIDKHKEYKNSQNEKDYNDITEITKYFNSSDLRGIIRDAAAFGFDYSDYTKNYIEAGWNLPLGTEKVKDINRFYTDDFENYKFGDLTLDEFVKEYAKLDKIHSSYYSEDSYFIKNYSKIVNKSYSERKISPSDVYRIVSKGFTYNAIRDVLAERESTNDIVKSVLEKNSKLFGDNWGTTWIDNNYTPEEILAVGGYDGVIIKNTVDYGGKSEGEKTPANLYVTFGSNQFNAFDNLTPTKDNDIRYSIASKDNKVVNFIKDNNGRNLSKGQQNYFKNTKAVDENGNLLTMYHGTPTGGFEIFDMEKRGTASDVYSNGDYGKGFYFTPSKEKAEGFTESEFVDSTSPEVYEVYLDMKNPLRLDVINKIEKGMNDLIREYGVFNIPDEAYDQLLSKYGISEDQYYEMKEIYENLGDNWQDIDLEEFGYDGIINENRSEFIVFNSNQIKRVDNKEPTNDENIKNSIMQDTRKNIQHKISRYSRIVKQMQKEGRSSDAWVPYSNEIIRLTEQLESGTYLLNNQTAQERFRNMFRTKEGTEMSELLQGAEIELDDPGYTPTQKAINYEQRQKNNFKRNMSDMLGISQYNKNNKTIFNDAIDEMQKEYNATGNISQETKDRVFENMYNGLIKEDAAYYNENKEIKNEIRNTTLYISDKTKADITDYGEFRKGIFGNVRLSNDKTDMPIDTFYKELNSQRPDLFPDTIVTLSDQLQRIAEVSKSIRKSERNLAAYENEMEAAEYKKWAKHEFEVQTSRLQEQFAFVNKYNESKQAEFEKKNAPYSRPDVAEIKAIYQSRNEMRKEVEKQERNILLTDREKAIVKRLLADEMDVDEIMPGYNREGIIKSYYARQQLDYLEKEVKRYKQDKKKELVETADNLITGIKDWKDKKIGLQYSRETAQRNIRDIMSKQEADRINKELFDPVLENTANQIRFINDYNKQIEELNLDKKAKYNWKDFDGKEIKIDEATLAQLLIEKKIDENYLTEIGADVEKITNAADTFSRILNEVVDMMDDVYVEFGYAPVERRKNYFPHFIENKPDTLFTKIADALNFSTNVAELPTDIAGRTESFKPGRAFNRNILKRTTDKTDFNALKALDMYLQGASDIIYHTADIQKLRAFQEAIRDNYRDAEVEKKILEIQENTEYTEDERAEKIRKIKEKIQTPLPKLVEWLDEYTNILANKKSSGDRQTEKDLNRKMYTIMQEIEGKIASNLIGGNLSVSLTNFAPLFQAMGTTELGNILIGMVQTAQNDIKAFTNKNDNFADMSDFLTSRRGNEQLQKQTVKQNISNVAGIPMQVIDNYVSESIVRAKYRENIKKGMDNDAALKAADTYARNLMADRSKGALPVLFARKNPLAKLMTSFQIEPNNIISNYFKDMKADAETKQKLALQVVKLSAASLVFNETLKAIRGGSDVIPNPIGFASKLIALAVANLNDDEEDDMDTLEVLKEVASDVLGSVPFGTTIANALSVIGVEGFEDTGKFMTSNALPNAVKLAGLFGEDVSPEYRKQTVGEEINKFIAYLGLPTGGAQLNKTAKGIKAFIEGGSYKYNKKGEKQLQFPVEQNVGNAIKTTVFGKYSLPGATKYIDEGFKSFNGNETKVYEESNIDFDELKAYFAYSKQEGVKKNDKITYVENMNISVNDKWNLYKHNIINSSARDDGTSQLSDAEFIINNNMATPEEYMDLYSNAEKNDVSFPSTKTLQELKDSGLSLKTYMDYTTNLTLGNRKKKAEYEAQNKMPVSKEEAEKRKSLNTEEKIQLTNKYTDKEKALIYENYIGKSDTVYQHLKQLTGKNVRINDYLELKTTDVSSDKKNDGTKKGKTITGSAEKKLVNFLDNSNFSNIEKIYIYGQSYKLDASQKQQFQNYISSLSLPYEEEKEIWLDLSPSNVVEMSDGSVRWK